MRERIALKDGWNFYKNMVSGFDAIAPGGELVTLPHTWNAEDGQDGETIITVGPAGISGKL